MKPRQIISSGLLAGIVFLALAPWMGVANLRAQGNKLPLVFVQGWKGLDFSTCSFPMDYPATYFQSVDDDLKAAGYHVEYARIETSFCFTPSIAANVPNLVAAIDRAKAATGQPKVILIAHSMGGLVSRAYIEDDALYRNDIASLFTFGSPHLGVPIDSLAWLGNGAPLGVYCIFQQVVCEFSTVGMFFFNLRYQQRAGVAYHTVAGDAPLLSRKPVGIVTGVLIDGPDDGIVPTASGVFLSTRRQDRWVTDEVHGPGGDGLLAFGSQTYFIRNGGTSYSYLGCLKKLLVDTPSASTCGRLGSPLSLAEAAEPVDGAPLRGTDEAAPALAERTPFEHGTLLGGQTVTRAISLEGGPAFFAARWDTGSVTATLIAPDGRRIDPAYARSHPDDVLYSGDATTAVYYLPHAEAGTWRMELQATGSAEQSTAYTTFAAFDSPVALDGQLDHSEFKVGATATITASLTGASPLARLTATIARADGVTESVTLTPSGPGQYKATFIVPNAPGYTEVRLVARGITIGGSTFERGKSLAFRILPDVGDGNKVFLPLALQAP